MPAAAGPYGRWVSQGPAVHESGPQPPPLEAVRLRLFCVPPAGMGGQAYHGWTRRLPEGVEVMPLELPARGLRMGEEVPYASSLAELARGVLDGVGLAVFAARPFVLFGHSFGAWVAYEMLRELARRAEHGWPLPLKLYVSACRPPHLSDVRHDPDALNPAIGSLGEADFWEAFEARYGCNPDLASPLIKGMVRKLLQADFGLLESYVPSSLEPLEVPLCALCAEGDNRRRRAGAAPGLGRCRPEQLSQWASLAPPGGFQERWFEGMVKPGWWATQHRYVVDNPVPLNRFLHADLPLVGRPPPEPGYAGSEGPLPRTGEPPLDAPGPPPAAPREPGWCAVA
ncbi:unnamed protein product [Prorocentrum cordatum]|uniref:Thioesterase domain-containing protein n=1 Tax=Prorocentrum cordatum TaxID=2364126 RepID=A0ABN9PAI5_9DINO|nr:unnamed protein product [Polarella glacialis]